MKFEEKLMSLRKTKGWSQEDLANQIGVSRQTISKWESSQTIPDMNKLIEMSKIFEISVDELINDDNKEEKAEEKTTVFSKINLKPTNILLIVACILILIGLIISILLYINKDSEELYVEDILMITYSFTMNENVYVTEIYSFNKNDECIGNSIYLEIINNNDYNTIVKEITESSNQERDMLYNIILNDNHITWSKKIYQKDTKEKVLKEKQESLSNVQDLKIIDM